MFKNLYLLLWTMILSCVFLLIYAVEAADLNKEKFNLSDKNNYVIVNKYANIKNKSLLIDTYSSKHTWSSCFKTKPGYFKPGKNYRIKVNCHTLKAVKKGYLLLLVRPFIKHNSSYDDIASRIVMDIEGNASIVLDFTVPADRSDYAFQVHTRGKITAKVTGIVIEELPGKSFISAVSNTKSTLDRLKTVKLPDGAKNFDVLQAELIPGNEIIVTAFGASVKAQDNTQAFQRAIDACAKKHGCKLLVPKGIYYFDSAKPLQFKGLRDFEFDGQGASFVVMNKRRFLDIQNCVKTKFCNFNIDWNWEKDPLCSVVKVEKVALDNTWGEFRFVNYKKFPLQNPRIVMLDLLDPTTMTVGHRKSFNIIFPHSLRNKKRTWIEPNLLRLDYNFKGVLKVGQLFRMPHYYYAGGGQGIALKNNLHQTFEKINIYSYRGSGIVVKGKQQYWQLLNSSITIPPDNKKRSISSTGDHLHVVNSKGFFKIESCDFGYGNDDCINVHDVSSFAIKSGDKSITTRNLRSWLALYYHKGDIVELKNLDYSPSGFKAKLTRIDAIDSAAGIYKMTFDQKVPDSKTFGFIVFNWRYDSRNIFIRNSKFHDNRGRGLLLLARDVTVENCKFNNHQVGAIHVETGFTIDRWCEGFGASNILIRNNVFTKANPKGRYVNEFKPDIYISTYIFADPSTEKATYPILNNILIDRNRFYDTTGAAVFIASAKNVFICNNVISNQEKHSIRYKYRGSIGIYNASDIFIYKNQWEGKYNHKAGAVFEVARVNNIFMAKNKVK